MKEPTVINVLVDPNTGGTYHVLAFRKLTQHELLDVIRRQLSMKGFNAPGRDRVAIIKTLIGAAG
jgi:hypothetical protein